MDSKSVLATQVMGVGYACQSIFPLLLYWWSPSSFTHASKSIRFLQCCMYHSAWVQWCLLTF